MRRSSIILFIFLSTASVHALCGDRNAFTLRNALLNDSIPVNGDPATAGLSGLFEGRKGTALLYSLVVPGSGQTLLGSPYKGFGFTFVAFGSTLTSIISHNNFIASNERLDALEFQYTTSTTWQVSDNLYHSMEETYTKMKRYQRMRNTFAAVSILVWSLNIADVIWNTDDEGETVFSLIKVEHAPVPLADGSQVQQTRFVVSLPLGGKP